MSPRSDRPPAWTAVFTALCAAGGLALNHAMVGDPDAFMLALFMALMATGIAVWRVWGS